MDKIFVQTLKTPFATFLVGILNDSCCIFEYKERRGLENFLMKLEENHSALIVNEEHNLHKDIQKEFKMYLDGTLKTFSIPLIFTGTDFQRLVWNEVLKIEFGKTSTYKDLAKKLNSSPRAIGSANGANHLAILVPCHRVVSATGGLVGYGGGLNRKKKLLEFEKKYSQPRLSQWV